MISPRMTGDRPGLLPWLRSIIQLYVLGRPWNVAVRMFEWDFVVRLALYNDQRRVPSRYIVLVTKVSK